MRIAASRALGYTVGTVVVGVVVVAASLAVVGPDRLRDVLVGVGVAVVVQVGIFWSLFVWALPEREALAHGLGMMVRFAVVAGMALVGVTALGLVPAPALLAMVASMFGSTLLEPFFIRRREVSGVPDGMTML